MKVTMPENERLLIRYGILEGKIKATWDLAVWKNGSPVVGVSEVPYVERIKAWETQQADIRKKLCMSECELLNCVGCPDCKASKTDLPASEIEI